jgi:hypothetical protein
MGDDVRATRGIRNATVVSEATTLFGVSVAVMRFRPLLQQFDPTAVAFLLKQCAPTMTSVHSVADNVNTKREVLLKQHFVEYFTLTFR